MERAGTLINKLKEQFEQGVSADKLFVTIQLLIYELQQQSLSNQGDVSVMLPKAILPNKQAETIKTESKPQQTKINTAIANHQWLILTFHDIQQKPSQVPDDYQYGTAELDQIAAYVQAKQTAGAIQSITVNQGLATGTPNLLANSSFDSGISGGWTTDDPANIVADANNNGSSPSPLNSVLLKSTTKNTHLFSPKIAVINGKTYEIDSNLNLKQISSGVVGFYIDEYDKNGNWSVRSVDNRG